VLLLSLLPPLPPLPLPLLQVAQLQKQYEEIAALAAAAGLQLEDPLSGSPPPKKQQQGAAAAPATDAAGTAPAAAAAPAKGPQPKAIEVAEGDRKVSVGVHALLPHHILGLLGQDVGSCMHLWVKGLRSAVSGLQYQKVLGLPLNGSNMHTPTDPCAFCKYVVSVTWRREYGLHSSAFKLAPFGVLE
jgi:hypothetical protein